MKNSTFEAQYAPFFANTQHDAFASAEATEQGEVRYEIIASAPRPDSSEVEGEGQAVELTVRWADTVLFVSHLQPKQAFSLGEGQVDLVIPEDRLGKARLELIQASASGSAVLVPHGATAKLEMDGRPLTLEEAMASGRCQATSEGHLLSLDLGVKASIKVGDLCFEVGGVRVGRSSFGRRSGDKKHWGFAALSTGLHAALVVTMLSFMPSLSSTETTDLTDEQAILLSQVLKAQAERELKEPEVEQKEQGPQSEAGAGQASPGERGKIGSQTSTQTNRQYAVQGDEKTRMLDRQAAIADAHNFGMVGMLASLQEGSKDQPVSPWALDPSGMDAMNANGNMFGALPGDAFGSGGLDLSGTGIGAGGLGNGVGLGSLNTAGFGSGNCLTCSGFGNGRLPGGRTGGAKLTMRPGNTNVSGRIPADVIQRVVRQNFGRFRGCYEAGLRNNPNLSGRVSVGFVIGRDGSVGTASNAGSDLPDAGVVSCVVKQFYGLSFPAPEDGVVRVSYPMMFTPG